MDYSPLLSTATALFEIAAAVWVLRGYGRRPILRTTAGILLFLAGYQIIEALLCSGWLPVGGSVLPRLAFMVVAWLPPTGLLLVAQLYPSRSRILHHFAIAMYIFCLVLVTCIALQPSFVAASVCLIVFARYTNPTALYGFYGIFYQFGLMSMLALSAYGVTICDDPRQRRLLGQVLLGSLAFILPSLVTVSVIPVAENALPSILCHFALFMALFLVRLVVIERRWEQEPSCEDALPASSFGTGAA
jgi:hypothetical protein